MGLSQGLIGSDGEVLVPLISSLPQRYTHYGHTQPFPDQPPAPPERKVQFSEAAAAPPTPEAAAPDAGGVPSPTDSPKAAAPSMD
eukprot:7103104-Alexandrium_andersonii.AAC.1